MDEDRLKSWVRWRCERNTGVQPAVMEVDFDRIGAIITCRAEGRRIIARYRWSKEHLRPARKGRLRRMANPK